jgi:ATP-dependent Clp protease adaptor protein ClpS
MTAMQPSGSDTESSEITQVKNQTREPSMYKVLLLNDDYTSMEFVVEILIGVFHKSIEDATAVMLKVHQQGTGLCGVYTQDVAETKIEQVHALAREKKFPLRCILEKE